MPAADPGGLVVEVLDDAGAVGRRAADLIASVVAARPGAVLGLATGSTPGTTYAELRRRCAAGELDLTSVTVFLLDEYVGLADGDPGSFRATIRQQLTDAVGIPPTRVHAPGPDGGYDDHIAAAGGVDLQLLGIGRNGHIAFNEPGTPFDALTHRAVLAETTRRDNARFFDHPGDVPTRAFTQGPATILRARRLLLLATGPAKADAVAAAVQGPVDPSCPASLIRRHPHVVVLVDRAAAAGLGRPEPEAGR